MRLTYVFPKGNFASCLMIFNSSDIDIVVHSTGIPPERHLEALEQLANKISASGISSDRTKVLVTAKVTITTFHDILTGCTDDIIFAVVYAETKTITNH